MRVLFLDDMEHRHDRFEEWRPPDWDVWHVRTADEAKRLLLQKTFDLAFLDHDLAAEHYCGVEDEHTGYAVARAIAEMHGKPRPVVIVHSWNTSGAERMRAKLAGLTQVVRMPFGPEMMNRVRG